jgi:hypothetical protein
MRQLNKIALCACFARVACCNVASADGGRIVLSEKQGNYQISAFAAPIPLRAGPVDISVLLQDSETKRPVVDDRVFITLKVQNDAGEVLQAIASKEAVTNKLMRAALLDLPHGGIWNFEVNVTSDHDISKVQFDLEAGPPLPRWITAWPWFGWPAIVVSIFIVHRVLVSRKHACLKQNLQLRSATAF